MKLTRRHFLGTLCAAGIAMAVGACRGLAGAARGCRARCVARFPGRIRPLRDGEARQPGKWAG